MKKSFRSSFLETRRNRLKRRSGDISHDVLTALCLTGAVGVTVALMIFAYFSVITSSFFQMEKTVITGCVKTTDQEVLALSGVQPKQNLLSFNTGKVERRIEANPWIEQARVHSEFPGKLVIDVRERKAVALMRKDQTLYLVDEQANPFKKLDENESAELPILTGFSESGPENRDLIRKSIELLKFLGRYDGFPRLENVSEIHGDENFGFSVFADNGIRIRLGFGGYEEKLKRLKPIMTDLARRNMQGYFLVDLNNPGKVVVQRRDAPSFPKFSKGYRT